MVTQQYLIKDFLNYRERGGETPSFYCTIGPCTIINKPTPLNHILNNYILNLSVKNWKSHRNSLFKPEINALKVMMIPESDEDGVTPTFGESDQAGGEPSRQFPFGIEHLIEEQRGMVLALLCDYLDVLRLELSQDTQVPPVQIKTNDT